MQEKLSTENYLPPFLIRAFVREMGGIPEGLNMDTIRTDDTYKLWKDLLELGSGYSIDNIPLSLDPSQFCDSFKYQITKNPGRYPAIVNCISQTALEHNRTIVLMNASSQDEPFIAREVAPQGRDGRSAASPLNAANCVAVITDGRPKTYHMGEQVCEGCSEFATSCSISNLAMADERRVVAKIFEKLGIRVSPRAAVDLLARINDYKLRNGLEGFNDKIDLNNIDRTLLGFDFRQRNVEENFALIAHDHSKGDLNTDAISYAKGRIEMGSLGGMPLRFENIESEVTVFSAKALLFLERAIKNLIVIQGNYECEGYINFVREQYREIDAWLRSVKRLKHVDVKMNILRDMLELPQVIEEAVDIKELVRDFVVQSEFVDQNSQRPVEVIMDMDDSDCRGRIDPTIIDRALLNIFSDVVNHGRQREDESTVRAHVGIHRVNTAQLGECIELTVTNSGYLDSVALAKIGKEYYSRLKGRKNGKGKVSNSNQFRKFYQAVGIDTQIAESILAEQWRLVDENGKEITDSDNADQDTTSVRWRILIPA